MLGIKRRLTHLGDSSRVVAFAKNVLLCCRRVHLVPNLIKVLKSYVLEFSLGVVHT